MTVNESRTSGGSGGAREGEDRLDFSALDPTRDAAAFETQLQAIRFATQSELARRRGAPGLLDLFLGWRRPILATSTLIAAASLVVLLSAPADTRSTSLAEAAGLSSTWAEWMGISAANGSGGPSAGPNGEGATE